MPHTCTCTVPVVVSATRTGKKVQVVNGINLCGRCSGEYVFPLKEIPKDISPAERYLHEVNLRNQGNLSGEEITIGFLIQLNAKIDKVLSILSQPTDVSQLSYSKKR